MNVGDRVKWSSEENGEKFTYTCVIRRIDESMNPKSIVMDVEELNVPVMVYEDDGTFEVIGKSDVTVKSEKTNVKKNVEVIEKKTAQKTESSNPRKRKTRDGSKKAKAVEIVKNNRDKSRKEIIEILKKELEMSDAGANTYYYLAKKEVN